ncbi:MAG: GNAT family N-acetyltransferase [Deltaproteobacteria bacterium]|nr:GNAT family N-acetyltransferase [Deltaproteobacteria bacterium]
MSASNQQMYMAYSAPETAQPVKNSHLERLKPSQLLPYLTEWQTFSYSAAHRQPFFQPYWFKNFAEAFEPDATIALLEAKADTRLIAILPLVESERFLRKIPARVLRSLSGIHSCRFDLVSGEENREVAIERCWQTLKDDGLWEVIEALDVPKGGAFEEMLRSAARDGYPVGIWPTRKSPFLPIPADPGNPFANCPAEYEGTRSRLKAKRRKLHKQGALTVDIIADECQQAVDQFFTLEASGWKGRKGSAIKGNTVLERFYRGVAESAARSGNLRMYRMTLNDEPIAMQFGLLMDDHYYIPKIAYSERHGKFSPGLLLMEDVITDLSQRGIKELDFLGPRMEWKCVWTSHVREHANLYIFRKGLKGRLLHSFGFRAASAARNVRMKFFGDEQEF